ncbi:MAG: hypothetical protein HN368_21245 [Spirochaetales bacterium]|jgi:MFS family permease|nr:hypothetical protein [Spirochaetales bacterium]
MSTIPTKPLHFSRDVVSGVLFKSSGWALLTLISFIAKKRLEAPVGLVGLLGSAAYLGYVWNLFFSRFTARVSLRSGIVIIMMVSGFLCIGLALQTKMITYILTALAFLTFFGLFDVQYNSLVVELYKQQERSRYLSFRYLVISLAATVLAAGFGRLSSTDLGRLAVFITAGFFMICGGLVFRTMRTQTSGRLIPFSPGQAVAVVFRDLALRRAAVILTLYGWIGAGITTILIVLYTQSNLVETQVGIIGATSTIGTLVAASIITPRMRFRGGITNFRLCFAGSGAAVLIYLVIGLSGPDSSSFIPLIIASFLFGISNGGFVIATQTVGINLAPEGKTTLYVNALMIVQGVRGILFPLITAAALAAFGIKGALVITAAIAIFCASVVWIPGIDRRAA